MVDKVKVAIVGYGHLGRWHLDKALSFPEVDVVGVVDPSPQTSDKLKERGLEVKVFSDLSDVIDLIDAAIVVAPTSLHFKLVSELVKKDKHVFCEKPMTSTYEEAMEIQGLLESRNTVFQVGHSERFHKIWQDRDEFKHYLTTDCHFTLERQAAFKGRATDVDVVQDLMIHDLDLAYYLFKESPLSLKAKGYKIRTSYWDYVRAELSFPSGRTATIVSGRNYTHEVRSLSVMGSKGGLTVDLLNCKSLMAPSDSTENHVLETSYEKRDHLLEEQQKFFTSIIKGDPVIVDIRDGVRAVSLVSKVLESLETGQVVEF